MKTPKACLTDVQHRQPARLEPQNLNLLQRGKKATCSDSLEYIQFNAKTPLRYDVGQIAQYFPLPVSLNGHQLRRRDFLEEASFVREWRGLRIGVQSYNRLSGINFKQLNFYGVCPDGAQLPAVTSADSSGYGQRAWAARAADMPQKGTHLLPQRSQTGTAPMTPTDTNPLWLNPDPEGRKLVRRAGKRHTMSQTGTAPVSLTGTHPPWLNQSPERRKQVQHQ